MNATARRRLTPVLALSCLLLGVLWVMLCKGLGRSPHWDARQTRALPVADAPPSPSSYLSPAALASFAAVWQHPLFMPTRRPDLVPVMELAPVRLDNVELTGTVLTGPLQVALLRDHGENKAVRVHLHEAYQGWTLSELTPRRAVFRREAAITELTLPALGTIASGTQAAVIEAAAVAETSPLSGSDAPSRASMAADGLPSELASAQVVSSTPAPKVSGDDSAARQAYLESLKAAVRRRRAQAAPMVP